MILKRIILPAFLLLSLTSCGGSSDIKSTLGLKKSAPDEFAVISHPPLSIPPSFDLNKPGNDLSPHFEFDESTEMNSKTLMNEDKAFLNEFGKPAPKTKVKSQIDEDHKKHVKTKQETGALRSAIQKMNGSKEEAVIDPVSERRRIRDNIATNTPINEGDVKNKSKTTLERVFGN